MPDTARLTFYCYQRFHLLLFEYAIKDRWKVLVLWNFSRIPRFSKRGWMLNNRIIPYKSTSYNDADREAPPFKAGRVHSKEEAGGLEFHLGHWILFVVCSLSPKTIISWLGPENPCDDGGLVGRQILSFLRELKKEVRRWPYKEKGRRGWSDLSCQN